MKKYIIVLLLVTLTIPYVAFASWWNPFSWSIFNGEIKEVAPLNIKTINSVNNPSAITASANNVKEYEVAKVIDGDTVDVFLDGKVERLRLIGIDTPETVDPRKSVQCFGREASNKAKALLTGKRVSLEGDKTQGERDKYGRLLRYVFLEDGTNFNLLMIKEGYAYEYTYGSPYKYQNEFKSEQKNAEISKKGLWASGVCKKESAPIITEKPIEPVTTKYIPVAERQIQQVAPRTSQCNPNYSGCLKIDAGDYDCAGGSGNGPNYTGKVQVVGIDEFRLDRDGDGWACEN